MSFCKATYNIYIYIYTYRSQCRHCRIHTTKWLLVPCRDFIQDVCRCYTSFGRCYQFLVVVILDSCFCMFLHHLMVSEIWRFTLLESCTLFKVKLRVCSKNAAILQLPLRYWCAWNPHQDYNRLGKIDFFPRCSATHHLEEFLEVNFPILDVSDWSQQVKRGHKVGKGCVFDVRDWCLQTIYLSERD